MTTDAPFSAIWAKSPVSGQSVGESVLGHTAAVVTTLTSLRSRLPRLQAIACCPDLWRRAFWACYLHDLGKVSPKFQAILRGEAPPWNHRHEVLSLAFVPFFLSLKSSDWEWVSATIASHHKDANEVLEERYDPHCEPDDLDLAGLTANLDTEQTAALLEHMLKTLPAFSHDTPVADVPSHGSAATQVLAAAQDNVLAALRAYDGLVRRLNREPADSNSNKTALALRGLVMQADHLASAHAPRLQEPDLPSPEVLMARAGFTSLMSHQKEAAETAGSLLLTAPTGTGKTEAALLWAQRQRREQPSNVLVYLLPYQASLNAIRRRFRHLLPDAEVALIHGRSLEAIFRELSSDSGDPRRAEAVARRLQDMSHMYHPPLWCATPYHLLRAAYRLPGYETLWSNLAGSLVVVDEVHAYEPARMGMFLGLLGELANHWATRICLMTATMPAWFRSLMEKTFTPRSVFADQRTVEQARRHRLNLHPAGILDPGPQDDAVAAVEGGHSVLLSVNTVAEARRLYCSLKHQLGNRAMLLHSRFTGRDRLDKERRLEEMLDCKHGNPQPMCVIATQVIEVSLNLDFDTIISELAPMEALLQRFGRVNRLGKKGIVPVTVLTNSSPASGRVYSSRLLAATLTTLNQHHGEVLDDHLATTLIDEVYAVDDLGQEYSSQVRRHEDEFRATCLASLRAFQSDSSLAEHFDELFDGTEVLPASLEQEFAAKREGSVLAAKELLVPISHRQLRAAGRRACWREDWRVHVLDLPYDSETGLDLASA